MLRLARSLEVPAIYTLWARTTLRLYQSLTSQGRLGRTLNMLMPAPEQ